MNTSFITLKNPIFRFDWAGWTSDTLALQENGWQISVEQDFFRGAIRFAIKHPVMKIYGVSDLIPLRYQEYARMGFVEPPRARLSWMASHFQVIMQMNPVEFKPIDARPQLIHHEYKTIEDFNIFRPLNTINEILIPQADVASLLDEIIKKQDPKQKEIRERIRRDERKFSQIIEGMELDAIGRLVEPKSDIVAQIVVAA